MLFRVFSNLKKLRFTSNWYSIHSDARELREKGAVLEIARDIKFSLNSSSVQEDGIESFLLAFQANLVSMYAHNDEWEP